VAVHPTPDCNIFSALLANRRLKSGTIISQSIVAVKCSILSNEILARLARNLPQSVIVNKMMLSSLTAKTPSAQRFV